MTEYAFEQSGRRPVVFIAAIATGFLLWTALSHGAPVIVWMLWSIVAVAISYMLIANPKTGMRLTPDSFEYWIDDGNTETIPLKMITHVEIQAWSDSTDYYVHWKNGRRDTIFSGCVPGNRKLEKILSERGIKVVRS